MILVDLVVVRMILGLKQRARLRECVFPALGVLHTLSGAMAKSKNHTNHNQIYKNHRNGIKRTRRPRKMSMNGMNCKFVRNQIYAKRGMKVSAEVREERLQQQKEAQKRIEEKRAADHQKRLKELEQEKQAAMLKAATKKR